MVIKCKRELQGLIVLVMLAFGGLFAQAQTSSPLQVVDFKKIPNQKANLKELKERVGRDTDFDSNKAALIKIKPQDFDNEIMLDFSIFPQSGVEIIDKLYRDDELWLYVSSNCWGTIMIKYMGEFEFKLPAKLDPKGIYELVLGIKTATLMVNTVPANADIYLDGLRIGRGKAKATITVGIEHRYKVVCNDYIPEEDVIKTDRTDNIEKQVELRPNFGFITIKTEPAGAEIFVDEIKVGVTPCEDKMLSLGQHGVEIRKFGYLPVADVIAIKMGDHNNVFEGVALEQDKSITKQQIEEYNKTSHNTTPSAYDGTHRFTVGTGMQVYFSQGNLQYQPSGKYWRFAENQWERLGRENQKLTSTADHCSYSGWIDLFGWGTSGYKDNNPCIIRDNEIGIYGDGRNDIDNTRYDWGVNNTISNGNSYRWRSLSQAEWEFLFNGRRTASGIRYVKAQVNGVNGMILLPDDWDEFLYILTNTNQKDSKYKDNIISLEKWMRVFESNGAVFLPASGNMNSGYFVNSEDISGYYWTTTAYNQKCALCMVFYYNYLNGNSDVLVHMAERNSCYSVRLVRNAEGFQEVASSQPAIKNNSKIKDKSKQAEDEFVKSGKFSVGAGKQVLFSPGNLRYRALYDDWRFAEQQWETVDEYDNTQISKMYAGWVDLFGWGTSGYDGKYPYMTTVGGSLYGHGMTDISGTKYDWGVFNSIYNGLGRVWRTLTVSEWDYVLNKRKTASGMRYVKALVDGRDGLVLLPDDWNAKLYALNEVNKSKGSYGNNHINETDWKNIFENNGAIFLPTGGSRVENRTSRGGGARGSYWTGSCSNSDHAYCVLFGDGKDGISVGFEQYRHVGYFVRLVCDVK